MGKQEVLMKNWNVSKWDKDVYNLCGIADKHAKLGNNVFVQYTSELVKAKIEDDVLYYETKNTKTVLLFKFELYCSNHPIGTSKQIRWKTNTKVQNPIFNKRIYFDRNYDKLPNCCSLLIKVKFIQYDKSNQVYKNSTVFWANYRLFDEDNKLKVGLQKVNLQSREVSDDVYYCYNDNSNSTNSYSTKSFNDNKNSIDKNKKNSIDSQSLQKEKGNSIKSQKIKYNNILDELSQSISSSKSNFTLNKINLYAKKTHKTKFGDKKENK